MGISQWFEPQARLERKFKRLGPWITKFTINGKAYGGWFDAMNDVRVDQFTAAFPNVRAVLELGSLEGGHSFALANRGASVLAIEGRSKNIKRGRFVQRVLGVKEVKFVHLNLDAQDALGIWVNSTRFIVAGFCTIL